MPRFKRRLQDESLQNQCENVFDKFIKLYDEKLDDWKQGTLKSNVYYHKNAPEPIKLLNDTFNKLYVPNRLVEAWGASSEMPELIDYELVYTLVNLLIHQNTTFMPKDIKDWIDYLLEENRLTPDESGLTPEKVAEYIKKTYSNTVKNLTNLNKRIIT